MVSPKADNRLLGRRTAMNTLQMLLCRVGAGLVLGASSVVSVPAEAEAQAFPSNPIRVVVPTAPSTPPDIISRVIATELSNSEGWKVIVENRPGAVMTIAGTDVLKQPADGTSIYAMSVPVTAASAFLQNMPFQPGLRSSDQDRDVL
jgi:tripartite-type tricarboxylate transporter receptor subunit TctC